MSTWNVAHVKDGGMSYAVVLVKDSAIQDLHGRDRIVMAWQAKLGCCVALLGERRFQTYGAAHVVGRLRNVHPSRLPWRQMRLAA